MDQHRVVIAGGGVGGLEALLALHEFAGDLVDVHLLSPADTYVQRAQLVAVPFGGPEPQRISLDELAAETGARHLRDTLAAVDPAARCVVTGAGETVPFDSLLVSVGAIAEEAVPGALTFPEPGEGGGLERILERLGRRDARRLAFAVAPGTEWSLPIYELALLTAAECRARRIEGVSLVLATHEPKPLRAAGESAHTLIEARLAEAGIELITGARTVRFARDRLELEEGEPIAADAAIALARLRGPRIEGLPHTPAGFLPIDVQMHVAGLDGVWAVGDATTQPVKQGGLAAQQADIAARGIAIRAGARVPRRGFDPVLRAAMVTGGPVDYLRRRMTTGTEPDVGDGRALWWPAAKVAGERLAARLSTGATPPGQQLVDLRDTAPDEVDELAPRPPSELLLAAADADAEAGEYARALSWLALVEQLDFIVPADHLARRAEWMRLAGESAQPDAATRRVDSSFASADAALSDVRRRVGWLREIGKRNGGEMAEHLEQLTADLEQVLRLSKRAGTR